MPTNYFAVVDAETTGLDPEKDGVCEVAFCLTTAAEVNDYMSHIVNPGVPISPEASAIHHLVDEDVQGAPPLDEAVRVIRESCGDRECWGSIAAYVAHNAPFDKAFLPMLRDRPWLDTLRMAKRYYPDFPSHSNQALRYRLKLPIDEELMQGEGMSAHRAAGDCVVTAALLRHMLNGPARVDYVHLGAAGFAEFIDGPMLLSVVNFGKHAGKKWSEVPKDYLQWILRQPDFDKDSVFTAKYYINR
jgi:exodeoxyribonuclease X